MEQDTTSQYTYSGSTHLSFLCTYTGLQIDQLNFITCQLSALLLSSFLLKFVRSPNTRLYTTLSIGLTFCVFCFGRETLHILFCGGGAYAIMYWGLKQEDSGGRQNIVTRIASSPYTTLTYCLLYLSLLHLKRQFIDSTNYSIDITGPLMVLVQKCSSLAMSLSDGDNISKKSELQERYQVKSLPSILNYSSYIFQFQSMLAGPLVFYRDYEEFIYREKRVPSPFIVVMKKVLLSAAFALLFIKYGGDYQLSGGTAAALTTTSFLYKLYFITLATSLERFKYYHAWILSDAVCNASGLGYDHQKQDWSLVSNVNAIKFECGMNLKESLDSWNIGTMRWLRYVVYERAEYKYRTGLVYVTSAVWHGFYPGYYITFLSGAIFTVAGRGIRSNVRPLFLTSSSAKSLYDMTTWVATRIVISYVTFSFVVREFGVSVEIFRSLFFFVHIGALLFILLCPVLKGVTSGNKKSVSMETGGDDEEKKILSEETQVNGSQSEEQNYKSDRYKFQNMIRRREAGYYSKE